MGNPKKEEIRKSSQLEKVGNKKKSRKLESVGNHKN